MLLPKSKGNIIGHRKQSLWISDVLFILTFVAALVC